MKYAQMCLYLSTFYFLSSVDNVVVGILLCSQTGWHIQQQMQTSEVVVFIPNSLNTVNHSFPII